MKHTTTRVSLVPVLLIGLAMHAGLVQASSDLSAEAVNTLLKDKTVFAWHERGRFNFTNFFAADGTVKQVNEKGEKLSGSWSVDSSGTLCVTWTDSSDSNCGKLQANGDGTYKRMRSNPRNLIGGAIHFVTFKRFENGNSQGL
jgi:hypothetical protein